MRQDLIGPRRLKPARREDESNPFVLVRELDNRVLKGIVGTRTISGQVNGVMPTIKVYDRPQPKLIMKASPDKVPGLEHHIAQTSSEYKNPDTSISAGKKSSKPTPKASPEASYQPPSSIQTSSVGTEAPVERQKPQAGYQPPVGVQTAGVGSSKKTAAPKKQSSYQPPAGTQSIELSLKEEETKKSLLVINDILNSFKK